MDLVKKALSTVGLGVQEILENRSDDITRALDKSEGKISVSVKIGLDQPERSSPCIVTYQVSYTKEKEVIKGKHIVSNQESLPGM